MSHAWVFQWHARFKTSRTSFDDDEHTGRHTSRTTPETVTQIQEPVRQDQRWTIHDMAEEVRISYGTCQWVLMEELGTHHVAAKFVPRILTADQKQQCISICTELNLKIKWLSSPTHRTPLIWHRVTSSYFQK